MDIFDFAMKMEKDGQAYYEKMAKMAGNAAMKKILVDLAHDEVKHYNIFKGFKEGNFAGATEMNASSTQVVSRAKNIFQQFAAKKVKLNFTSDVQQSWREAQKIEKKSEDFYREKAAAAENDIVRKTILLIADEEQKHWALIENVLQFLDRPNQWLENAEWGHLDDY